MADAACAGLEMRDRRGRVPNDGAYEADTARLIHFCDDRTDSVSRLLTLEAKRFCEDRCPVQSDCLAYAIEANIRDGVWGGMTPRERSDYQRRWRQSTVAV